MSAVMAPWPDSEHHVDEHNAGIPDAVFVKLMIAMFTSTFIFVFLGGFLNHLRNNRSFSSGLNASILNSLPVFVYSKTKGKINANDVVEDCAVCLSEFEERDQCLVLPNCKHCFHSGCIHMWLSNHSTCPLCRSPVVIVDQVTTPHPTTASSIQTTTTTSSEPAVVDVRIDIVPVVNETEPGNCVPRNESSQTTNQVEEEEEEISSINMSQSLV
ncbi:putative transcription factor C2H2 family [Helianthus anomalus]